MFSSDQPLRLELWRRSRNAPWKRSKQNNKLLQEVLQESDRIASVQGRNSGYWYCAGVGVWNNKISGTSWGLAEWEAGNVLTHAYCSEPSRWWKVLRIARRPDHRPLVLLSSIPMFYHTPKACNPSAYSSRY